MNWTKKNTRSEAARIEAIALVMLLLASAVWRVILLRRTLINPDELFLVGGAYRVLHGVLPCVDYIDPRTPLGYKIYALLVAWVGERPDFVEVFRWIHWAMALGFQAVLFLQVARAYGRLEALWALGILNSFSFFILRTVHVRPDLPALWIFFVFLLAISPQATGRRVSVQAALAGLGFGLATSIHITLLFPSAAVGLWLLLEEWKRERGPSALVAPLWMGAAWSVGCFLGFFVVFKSRIVELFRIYVQMFALEKVYIAYQRDTGTILRQVLSESAVSWLLVGGALVAGHWRWFKGAWRDSAGPLYLLLADSGVLFLLIRKQKFEQHYILVVLFGSIVAATFVRSWIARATHRFRRLPRGWCGALAVLLLATAAAVSSYRMTTRINDETASQLVQASDVPAGVEKENGTCDPEILAAWLQHRRDGYRTPFWARPKRQQVAQLRFLLAHSAPDSVVYTDWMNPPFRRLPAPYNHGLMIPRFFGSQTLRESPELVRLVRRYDPTYSADDPSVANGLIRLFQAAPPRAILIEGALGDAFCRSEELRRWIGDRYRIVMDPDSVSFFAVR